MQDSGTKSGLKVAEGQQSLEERKLLDNFHLRPFADGVEQFLVTHNPSRAGTLVHKGPGKWKLL